MAVAMSGGQLQQVWTSQRPQGVTDLQLVFGVLEKRGPRNTPERAPGLLLVDSSQVECFFWPLD